MFHITSEIRAFRILQMLQIYTADIGNSWGRQTILPECVAFRGTFKKLRCVDSSQPVLLYNGLASIVLEEFLVYTRPVYFVSGQWTSHHHRHGHSLSVVRIADQFLAQIQLEQG